MKIEKEAKYLGDVFNSKGDNSGLTKDRGAKATRCLVGCLAECYAVTRGCKAIKSLILLYKMVYLKTVIFNSEAWILVEEDVKKLGVIQMKFLKRMLQVPKQTPNSLILLELGLPPIELEVISRQLNFLHDILSLPDTDPVRSAYDQQKLFVYEENWVKGIKRSMRRCNITESEEEIASLSDLEWKQLVHTKIQHTALTELNKQRAMLKKGVQSNYESLQAQMYFEHLGIWDARTMFKIRSETLDVKAFKKFKYEDTICRLCESEVEDTHHIVNICDRIPRARDEHINLEASDMDSIKEVIRCINLFEMAV